MTDQLAAAVAAEEAQEKPVEISIDDTDDRKVYAYKPADGQLAMLMASFGRGMSSNDMVAATVNFFCGLFEDDDRIYIEDRLLSRKNNIPIERIQDLMEELIEKWSARPTPPPSGSVSLQPNGGSNSTPTTSESIF